MLDLCPGFRDDSCARNRVMRIAPLLAAIAAIALPALPGPALAAPVTPDVVRQLKELADAHFTASPPAPTKKTPEQVSAEKKDTQRSEESLAGKEGEKKY